MNRKQDLPFGVAQWKCLVPLLFSLCMLLGNIVCQLNVSFHNYADDTQLYISVEPTNPDSLRSLTACLTSINQWNDNFLSLIRIKQILLLVQN